MAGNKQIPTIQVERREELGSRYSKRLRKAGRLPAVIYGHKQDPVHVTADYKEVVGHLHRNAHLLNAQLDGKTESVLIRDVQWDHLGSNIIHIDLARVDLTERVTVEVPLHFVGDAPGLKSEGAILEHQITEIEVEALAVEIPEEIRVDVSGLELGQTITVGDLKLPSGVTTKLDPETIIASISVVEEQKEADPSDAPAEPKLIGRKTEEGEEAAAGDAKKK